VLIIPVSRLRNLDLNLLLTLDALYQTGQVSAAAERLGVSQPAVSQGLRALREHFDDPLFVRTGRFLSLTPRAQALRTPLQRIVRELHEHLLTSPRFEPATAERIFTLCLSDLAEFVYLGDFLAALRAQAPHCRLRSLRVPVHEIPSMLEAGRADLAFGGMLPEMPAALRQRRMMDYGYVCIMASDHPAAGKPLNKAGYSALSHVIVSRSGDFEDFIEKELRRLRLRRHAVASLSDTTMAAKLVANSDLIATVPSGAAERLAAIFPLAIANLPVSVPRVVSRMYWHERFHRDPANQWLRELAQAYFSVEA